MNRSTPGIPVHHQLPEFTQTLVHWVSDTIHLILCRPLLLLYPTPASIRVFPMSQLFAWDGLSIGVSASASAQPLPKRNQSDYCFFWHFPIGINCLFLIWMNFWLHNWKKVKNIKSIDSALEAKLLILHDFCQQEPNKQSVIKAYDWAKCNLPFRLLAPYAFVDKEVSSFWISGAPFGGTPVSSDNTDFLCVKAWGTPCHTRLWLSTVILSKA